MFTIARAPFLLAAGLLVVLTSGCSTTMPDRVARPWFRIDRASTAIPTRAHVWVEATGQRLPLLGNPHYANKDITGQVLASLERRGFQPDSLAASVFFRVAYKTERRDFTESSTRYSTSFFASSRHVAAAASHSSPGVGLAAAVGALASESGSRTSFYQHTYPEHFFTHTIAMTATSSDGDTLWQAESTWDSPNVDLSDDLSFYIQSATSSLPSDPDYIVELPTIPRERSRDYFRAFCIDRWFTCPGLPYRIYFYGPGPGSLPGSYNWQQLPAYVDLVQHAEYALPEIDVKTIDLLEPKNWARVTLCGRYRNPGSSEIIYVAVRLAAREYGYVVKECSVVTEQEYAKYQEQMRVWQDRVRAFWDFYQR